ncbi:MAG: hypothetical protein LAO78_03505 [Acidobacteriia bacterium]|nr:hypothetical protein [Terriglobia bacterium]
MAVTESKRSSAHAQPATTSTAKHRSSTRRRQQLPDSLRSTVTKRGKTTIRRFPGRSFHRFEEAKGKAIDYIEFFTSDGFHNIDIAFEDRTAMHFVIEPSFNLETDYADWKTGNWRSLKRWPPIRSAGSNS